MEPYCCQSDEFRGSMTDIDRDSAIAAAETYLHGGTVASEPARPQPAASCIRHENGWNTDTEREIRDHLPHMTMCEAINNLHWVVELPASPSGSNCWSIRSTGTAIR